MDSLPDFEPHYSNGKPKIIGIYGVSGCGKTTLLTELKSRLGHDHYLYFDGSELILRVMEPDATIDDFQQQPEENKIELRKQAILRIKEDCSSAKKAGIVAGHLMLYEDGSDPQDIHTQADLETYTHIVYLDVPPAIVLERREQDDKKQRPRITLETIDFWQVAEKTGLRELCLENKILFVNVDFKTNPTNTAIAVIIQDFMQRSEHYNNTLAMRYVDCAVRNHGDGARDRCR